MSARWFRCQRCSRGIASRYGRCEKCRQDVAVECGVLILLIGVLVAAAFHRGILQKAGAAISAALDQAVEW